MTRTSHLARCAPLAIAATLALGSTPLLAQDAASAPTMAAQPVIVVPDPAPAPPASAPAPAIVIPQELTQPQAESPAPLPSAQSTAAAAPRPAATRTTQSAASRPAPAAARPLVDEVAPIADNAPPPALEPIPVAEPAPTTAQADEIDTTMAIALGGIAALGLFGIGFSALRRRTPRRYAAAPKAAPVAETVPPPAVLPAAPQFAYSTAAFIPPQSRPRAAGGLSHSGASVALPREIPASFEEREALIQRMVAAAPDRANPFQSRGARWKRARLIVQSLGRDFAEADPWIDLSQYPSNWPELARRQSAAA